MTNPATLLFALDSNWNSSYLSKHKEFTTERAENVFWSEVMAKKHTKRCSTSLIIREMQIKTTTRYLSLTPVRMAIIKKSTNTGEGVEKNKTLLYCWWKCKLIQSLWRTIWRFLKELKNRTIIWSSNPTPGHISREKHNLKGSMLPNVHYSTVYNSQDM